MPFSRRQLRWAHTENGLQALGADRVQAWDKESKGKDLPERSVGAHEPDAFKRGKAKKVNPLGR